MTGERSALAARARRVFSWAFLFVSLAGCGGETVGNVAVEAACTDYATALCGRIAACSAFDLAVRFGTMNVCVASGRQQCIDQMSAPGTTWTGAGLEACGQAWGALSCEAFLALQGAPTACRPTPGALAQGAMCRYDAQCMSTRCLPSLSGGACGTCVAVAGLGQSCVQAQCEYGLVCAPGPRTCVMPAAPGEGCDAMTRPCRRGGDCVVSGTAGTCVARPAMTGAPCNGRMGRPCDDRQGFICSTASLTCQPINLSDAGGMCGLVNGALTVCRTGGYAGCRLDAMATSGTCLPYSRVGERCDDLNGPACEPPARCARDADGGAGGTCVLATAALCR